MVGCTVRVALALTIGRALREGTENPNKQENDITPNLYLVNVPVQHRFIHTKRTNNQICMGIKTVTGRLLALIDDRDQTLFSTWVPIMIQICVSPQSKTKVGWKRAGSPLA